MNSPSKPVTRLCYADPDRILVRGRDLCTELVGRMSFTQMMLFHLTGVSPSPQQVAIVDAVLITIMEHGLTPSAISARLTYLGAPETLQGAVAAGILGVGSRFAGTSGDCVALLQEIVNAPEDRRKTVAQAIVKRFREEKRQLPGYGHPVHKTADPRVARLVEIAREEGVAGRYVDAMYFLGETLNEMTGRNLVINASAAMGAVMAEVGIPLAVMRGLVIVSRAAGLVGHLFEEMQDPAATRIWSLAEEGIPYSES